MPLTVILVNIHWRQDSCINASTPLFEIRPERQLDENCRLKVFDRFISAVFVVIIARIKGNINMDALQEQTRTAVKFPTHRDPTAGLISPQFPIPSPRSSSKRAVEVFRWVGKLTNQLHPPTQLATRTSKLTSCHAKSWVNTDYVVSGIQAEA
jgi:hypothetical protein